VGTVNLFVNGYFKDRNILGGSMDYSQMRSNQLEGLLGSQAQSALGIAPGFFQQSFSPLDELLRNASAVNVSYSERYNRAIEDFKRDSKDIYKICDSEIRRIVYEVI